jgi:hypothetical protein
MVIKNKVKKRKDEANKYSSCNKSKKIALKFITNSSKYNSLNASKRLLDPYEIRNGKSLN